MESGVWMQMSLVSEFWDPIFQRGLFDVNMMLVLNGAERTVAQWWVPALACLFFWAACSSIYGYISELVTCSQPDWLWSI